MDPDHRSGLDQLDDFVDVVADDQLRLMFLCCHPALGPDAQVALTLRLLEGSTCPRSPRRSSRPRRRSRSASCGRSASSVTTTPPYRLPRPAELPDRLHVVLTAISLIFTEGHTATSGDRLVRTDLTAAALRLGRVLVELMPDEPEAVGLLALMLLADARRPARIDANGSMVRLADQDRSRWDRAMIAEGHALVRACLRRNQPGPFQIQAAIAAVHADAPTAVATDWRQIVALYDHLLALQPNAVVAINRAAALAELHGAAAGLDALDAIEIELVRTYQPYHAARADLLRRVGREAAAVAAYDRALELTTNPPEREFLIGRRDRT
jgi:RNA polymerase sigma-70 factor (ECF subfamily)